MQKYILETGLESEWYAIPADQIDDFHASMFHVENFDDSDTSAFFAEVDKFDEMWSRYQISDPQGLEVWMK